MRIKFFQSCLLVILSIAGGSPDASAQTPVAATFDAVTNYGVRQITVAGKNLLTGCGLGFIGSQTGADNQGNITTCIANNGGVMRPFSGSSPTLPFNLTFTKDSQSSNTLLFSGRIGPSAYNLATVSMPMDAIRDFTYWRYYGSNTLQEYDNNSSCYSSNPLPICVASAPGYPQSGDIIGTDFTIRVTITSSSRSMPLYFVEAPGLGVRNVEFSFGSVRVGESATIAGKVQVFKTSSATLPSYVYQSEGTSFHQIGRPDSDGWSVKVGDSPNKYMVYGPYATIFPSGLRTASFRLMVDNVNYDNAGILRIDAYDSTAGIVLSERSITRGMFSTPFVYQEFVLPFYPQNGHSIELRTFWKGGSYVRQDSVLVR